MVNSSNHTKCISWKNQQYLTKPTLINVHSNQCTKGLHCYTFAINLDRCIRSSNTVNDLSNKVCVRNKTDDLNLSFFNIIQK